MNYQIIIGKRARRFISSQNAEQQKRIIKAISELPIKGYIKPIQGKENVYRLRVGDYRIIFSIDNDRLIIFVAEAGNRGDVYKKIKNL